MTLIKSLAQAASPVLNLAYVRRVRRNHGLEHATVHLLSARVPNQGMAGRSDGEGFWLLGDLETAQVEAAAREALRRMQGGEHKLAIHPNCGTSLLTTGTMVGLVALGGSVGVKRGAAQYFTRLSTVISMSIVAILLSRPVGLQLQEHFTTLGDPGDLEIVSIERRESAGPMGGTMILHRITTRSS